ncbi:MAG: hypothetical protein Q4G69_14710, partial [Planctomycetia bacterium]|nr:hypothetical protein [Planctomycetia bacterium]
PLELLLLPLRPPELPLELLLLPLVCAQRDSPAKAIKNRTEKINAIKRIERLFRLMNFSQIL